MIAMTILKACGAFPELWDKVASSGDIANFQTIFNLVPAVVLLPFTNLLVKITYLVVKSDAKEKKQENDMREDEEKFWKEKKEKLVRRNEVS